MHESLWNWANFNEEKKKYVLYNVCLKNCLIPSIYYLLVHFQKKEHDLRTHDDNINAHFY